MNDTPHRRSEPDPTEPPSAGSETGASSPPSATATKAIREHLQLEARLKGGASWFYWIAGLSLINTLIILGGGDWSFVVGLGTTQVVDAVALVVTQENPSLETAAKVIAGAVNVAIAGVFVLFGRLAHARKTWAFVVGMILYALDGALFLLVQDWLAIGFHAFALFCMLGGYGALRQLNARPDLEPAAAPDP